MNKHTTHEAIPEILRALEVLFEPGTVVELRALDVEDGHRRGTYSGYFNNPEKLARAAAAVEQRARGVYVTLNPLNPALLARAENRARMVGAGESTTTDSEVLCRRWLPIDLDPARPSGISSTNEEKEFARQRAYEIVDWLKKFGWPEPVMADSGNGMHLLYRVDLPNDDAARELIRRCLEALSIQFADERVKIDTSVHNAARIWRLYGTLVRKGDSTSDRPHRRSKLLYVPAPLEVVPLELLDRLAARVPKTEPKPVGGGADDGYWVKDVDAYLAKHGIEVIRRAPYGDGGRKWVLKECVWCRNQDKSAFIIQSADGRIAAGCHHNRCEGKGWADFRDAVEGPGWRQRLAAQRRSERNERSERSELGPKAVASQAKPAPEAEAGVEEFILDAAPDMIRRPLTLVGEHAYAATWLYVKGDDQGVDPVLAIIRNDGAIFSDAIPGARHLSDLGLKVSLPEIPPTNRIWSGAGVKRYLKGERPDPADVFSRVCDVVDRFMDFRRSLADQQVMCELVGCFVLATYLLDAFNVAPYLWLDYANYRMTFHTAR